MIRSASRAWLAAGSPSSSSTVGWPLGSGASSGGARLAGRLQKAAPIARQLERRKNVVAAQKLDRIQDLGRSQPAEPCRGDYRGEAVVSERLMHGDRMTRPPASVIAARTAVSASERRAAEL